MRHIKLKMRIVKLLKGSDNSNPIIDCCWQVLLCRTICMSCGVSWTSCCLRYFPPLMILMNGLIWPTKTTSIYPTKKRPERMTRLLNNYIKSFDLSCFEESKERSRKAYFPRLRCISTLESLKPRSRYTDSSSRSLRLKRVHPSATTKIFWYNLEKSVTTLICSLESSQMMLQNWVIISSKRAARCNSWTDSSTKRKRTIVKPWSSLDLHRCWIFWRTTADTWSTNIADLMEVQSSMTDNYKLMTSLRLTQTSLSS